MLVKILEQQDVILKNIVEFRNEQITQKYLLAVISDKISDLERVVTVMSKSTNKIEQFNSCLNQLKTSVVDTSEKLVAIEDRSRRSNLVTYGLVEKVNETEDDLKNEGVNALFNKKLSVKCCSIGRIHRLGKKPGNRPVVLYLQDYNEKQEILKNGKKLKCTDVFIKNHYSRCTLRRRKLLWDSAKIEKANGKKPYILHDKLRIDNDTYMWDDNSNRRVKVQTITSPNLSNPSHLAETA